MLIALFKSSNLTETFIVINLGPLGSGKSTIAKEVCRSEANIAGDDKDVISRTLSCSSLSELTNDLRHLFIELGFQKERTFSEGITWDILKTMYSKMNEFYPKHQKQFIFDNTENVDDILKITYGMMLPEHNKLWKILIATHDAPAAAQYSEIEQKSFIQISGFALSNTIKLVTPNTIGEGAVKEIHSELRGNPLALTIIMKKINSQQVRQKV